MEPKIISESDIDPVEYCAVPNAYFAASVRRAGAVSLEDAVVVVVVVSSVFLPPNEATLDALVYFNVSISLEIDDVLTIVDDVVVEIALPYASEVFDDGT